MAYELYKNKDEKLKEYFYKILKFIYMANGGFFIVAIVYISIYPKHDFGIVIIMITGFTLIVGTLVYLFKFVKVIFQGFFKKYFSCETLKEWYRLTCDAWEYIRLTDPCCKMDENATNYNQDMDWNKCFNEAMKYLKCISIILSMVSFLLFLLCLTIVWLILKIFISLIQQIIKCAKSKMKESPLNPNSNSNNSNHRENLGNNQAKLNPIIYDSNNNNFQFSGNNNQNTLANNRNISQIIPNINLNMDMNMNNNPAYKLNRRKSFNKINKKHKKHKKRKSGEISRGKISIQEIEEIHSNKKNKKDE